MAEGVSKSLAWDIRKSLLTLSAGEPFQVVRSVGSPVEREHPGLDEEDQEGFNHISSFRSSKHLRDSDDGGMVELFMLKDLVDEVVRNRGVYCI